MNHPTTQAPAKVNIFLKITGHDGRFHTLLSRFVRVDTLYDTLSFIPQACSDFTLEGCEGVTLQDNTVYKAYRALQAYAPRIAAFFRAHKVVLDKRIPSGAGLGGGSSDAAAFLRLTNDICRLNIPLVTLASIGASVGADVPFFIYDYPSANVSGFGEVIEPFEEDAPKLELFTPPIHCDTAAVYRTFKDTLLPHIDTASFQGWQNRPSLELLKCYDAPMLNDLFQAARIVYPQLDDVWEKGWYFSGSGSSFFRPIKREIT